MNYLGHDYVEIAGIKWATMNVGANSITDYGLYFQWGDTQGYTAEQVGSGEGKKNFGWVDYKYGNGTSSPSATGMTKYNSTDGKTVLDLSDDAARANMGGLWRMPTTAEFQALGNAVNTAWTSSYEGSGVRGLVCTDKTDSSKVLFFPAAGYCNNGSVYNVGSYGSYWSSSLDGSDVQYAYYLNFISSTVNWQRNSHRFNGFAVRAVFTGEPEPEDLTDEELSYSSNSAIVLGDLNDAIPTLTNTHDLELTFNSSDTEVAIVNSSGIVSIVGNGTTTISATFAGNSEYNEKTISYVLTVNVKKYLDYEGLQTYHTNICNIIKDNELVVSSALNDLNENKADKSTTYIKTEIDNMIGNIETLLAAI